MYTLKWFLCFLSNNTFFVWNSYAISLLLFDYIYCLFNYLFFTFLGECSFCVFFFFQYKDQLSGYRDSQYKNKTIMKPSYLYDVNLYTGKMTPLYIKGPQISFLSMAEQGLS